MFTAVAVTDEAILTAITGVGGELHGVKVGLVVNAVTWGKGTVLADCTEPTFPGYAQTTPTWTAPFRAVDGTYRVSTGLNIFQPTGVSTDTILGYFLVDTTGAILIGGDNFPNPIPLADASSRLAFTFDWNGSNAAQGVADQVN